jgi:hypothetical protein
MGKEFKLTSCSRASRFIVFNELKIQLEIGVIERRKKEGKETD